MVIVGETVFSDLKHIPAVPQSPSYCISRILAPNDIYGYGYGSTECTFNEIDKQFELNVIYSTIKPTLSAIDELNKKIDTITRDIEGYQSQIKNAENQYNLSLQETQANSQKLYNKTALQNTITSYRNQKAILETQKATLLSQKTALENQIIDPKANLKAAYEKATKEYARQMAVYRFKTFGLTLIFILPFFIISTLQYFRLKRHNSPFTIIATGVMLASSLLFLQTVLVFLYEILPKEWLTLIFNFLLALPFFRYVLYYGSVLLVIAVFGGIVYIIQKKIFDPKRIAIRRLKENKCPHCSFTINHHLDYCPQCSHKLKEKCLSCGEKRITDLTFCPSCGKTNNVPQQPTVSATDLPK